jgi:hypothetical protein
LGYAVFGELPDYSAGQVRSFLCKRLVTAGSPDAEPGTAVDRGGRGFVMEDAEVMSHGLDGWTTNPFGADPLGRFDHDEPEAEPSATTNEAAR